ncbi:hypothetical protein AB0H77_27035 [Streptomyces sp. NPDC050844]|uniref:hypothetical protein n=1 Tax=Streptomyces sp. NPDC050844 TaxID=3155790 RepID=UPI0033F3406A
MVRKYLAALREGHTEPVRTDIPSPHKITGWIMRPRESLTDEQEQQLLQVRLACPDITGPATSHASSLTWPVTAVATC